MLNIADNSRRVTLQLQMVRHHVHCHTGESTWTLIKLCKIWNFFIFDLKVHTGVNMESGKHALRSEQISTSSLMDFRKAEQFSDVIIDVFGVKIAAHKIVLAANSEFFRTLFCSPLNEISGEVVTFGDSATDRARWVRLGTQQGVEWACPGWSWLSQRSSHWSTISTQDASRPPPSSRWNNLHWGY